MGSSNDQVVSVRIVETATGQQQEYEEKKKRESLLVVVLVLRGRTLGWVRESLRLAERDGERERESLKNTTTSPERGLAVQFQFSV